jgi:glycosyltransferase involved in cell wall biosynthesis
MFILTDFPRFPESKTLKDGTTVAASTLLAHASLKDMPRLLTLIRRADLILAQDSVNILGMALFFCFVPFLKKPIMAVDLILRMPRTPKQKGIARLKRFLLNRVDHFVFYFKELKGYKTYYGISPERSSYVPFKSNMEGNPKVAGVVPTHTEEYVFSAGRSLRDFDTLFDALSRLPYPAAIPEPNFKELRRHGARFTWKLGKLPKNLTLLPDDGSPASWIRNLSRAKVVVVPTLRDNLCASGIGTYLDAMRLGKCVVISDGPGVSDLLREEVLIVPPEDPAALAAAIQKAWEDSALRSTTASRGHHYVTALGGEPELMNRLFNRATEWFMKSRASGKRG